MNLSQSSISSHFLNSGLTKTQTDTTVSELDNDLPYQKLPTLPYAIDALTPYLSAHAITLHYKQHYLNSVMALQEATAGTRYAGMSLERILKETFDKRLLAKTTFQHATHIWNHLFYWNSLKPNAGDKTPPSGHLLRLINRDFGHFSDSSRNDKGDWLNPGFKQTFFDAAHQHSGNGWVWLVMAKGKLEIITTNRSEVLFTEALKPLCVIDLWEHAYCLDYPNKRNDYIKNVLDKLMNWDFAAKNLKRKY